jgi:hypothetical protein
VTPEEASKLSVEQLRAASLSQNDQELAAAVEIAGTPNGAVMMASAMSVAADLLQSGEPVSQFLAILIRIGFVAVAEAHHQRNGVADG